MTTIRISLPRPFHEYVIMQAAEDGYVSAAEFLRDLVRQDMRRRTRSQVDLPIEQAKDVVPEAPEHLQSPCA